MKQSTAKRLFIALALLLMVLLIVGLLSACDAFEPPIEETFTDHCTIVEDFEFYQATTNTIIGDGKQWRLITAHGDVDLKDAVYEKASTFQYARICYKVSDTTQELSYNYAADASVLPEPIIVYEEVEVEVIIIQEVLTHSVIDEDFIAEDGMFYYYIGDDIVNLVYKQGLEMFTMNILYDKNLIATDQTLMHSITYFDGVYIGHLLDATGWKDATVEMLDGTTTEFNSIEELLQFMILHYSFDEVKADWIAMTDEDFNTFPPGIWAEETPDEG